MNPTSFERARVRPFRVGERKWEAEDIFTLVLEPESGEEMFLFVAGQWVYLHLLNEDGSPWARAAFTIASAPEESMGGCELGIKINRDFTKRASQLQPGDRVGLQGPFGVFVLPEGERHLAMFAGGIGITPFRSMIRSLILRDAPTNVTLFYSSRFVESAVYAEEFKRLSRDWPRLCAVITLTGDAVPRAWDGETGRINDEMISKHLTDFQDTYFLVCGPNAFMEDVKRMLENAGVDVKNRFKTERFG